MKRFLTLLVLVCLVTLASIAGAANAVAPVAVAVPTVGFLDWFKQNTPAVLGFALALSELLSLIPAFKGNGILDTIIKALKVLSEKPAE